MVLAKSKWIEMFQWMFHLFPILGTAFLGWGYILIKILKKLYQYFQSKPFLEKIFTVFLALQAVFSGLGWFQYQIRFQDTIETIMVYGDLVVVFLPLSLLHLFLLSLWKSPWVWPLFFLSQTLMGVLLVAGVLYPQEFFVDFIQPSDYQYSISFLLFVLAYFFSFLFGILSYRQDRKKFYSPSIPTKS